LEKPLLPQAVLLVPENQRDFIRDNKLFDLLNEYKEKRTYRERIVEASNKYVLLFRNSYIRDFGITPKLLENARFFYSMWSGYWNENDKSYGKVVRFVKKNNLEKIDIHTSGHASVKDLKSFVEKLGSPLVTPIHTFYPEQFPSLFKNVKIHQDGEWFTV
jgi:ribonuclease J